MIAELGSCVAYINPGTGSLLLQFLLVGVAGVFVTFRNSKAWFTERFSRKKNPPRS
ncbi:MAG: hypothetical protein HY595_03445 [Candidatus Omnitrophica bacterium]|nr:hypothetical protein [Candidatus Omnitrophota bacterium]